MARLLNVRSHLSYSVKLFFKIFWINNIWMQQYVNIFVVFSDRAEMMKDDLQEHVK